MARYEIPEKVGKVRVAMALGNKFVVWDVDNDGAVDIAVADFGQTGFAGKVRIFRGPDFAEVQSVGPSQPVFGFGGAITAGDFDGNGFRSLVVQEVAGGRGAARDRLDMAADQAIALAGGDMRSAIRALILVNEYLEAELATQVSRGFTRGIRHGRFNTYSG